MQSLAKFLSTTFLIGALIFGVASLGALKEVLQSSPEQDAALTTRLAFGSAILFAMAVTQGMAWWTLQTRKGSARGWAIAASATDVIAGSVPVILSVVFWNTAWLKVFLMGTMWVSVIGVTGLLVCVRHGVFPQSVAPATRGPRLIGDGSSRLLGAVAVLAESFGAYAWFLWLWRRGQADGLPVGHGSYFLEFVLAALISVTVHELGHVVAGVTLGFKLRALIVGPLRWSIRRGRWEFGLDPTGFLLPGGETGLAQTSAENRRWHEVAMIAAGPVASLCLGLLAQWAALTAKGRPWEQGWEFLAAIGATSSVVFVVNIVPFRPESNYSDGALIYQILSGSPWADMRRAFWIAISSTVTALRPRDYDIAAVQRAADFLTSGREALLLRLFASAYFFDLSRHSQAARAMAEAESIYEQSASDVRAELLTEFVFGNAFLKRDAGRARMWWERMEAGKPKHDLVDYWLARSALLWIENNLEEAGEAWRKADALAQQLPNAGAYEFDRYRVKQLRQVLDAAIPE